MSVLIEAINIVVTNRALARHYPGGVTGFARDCPKASFCTDGRISRVGFLGQRETGLFLELLAACGLVCPARGRSGVDMAAAEVAVVDQNSGPLHPCLWLELGHDRTGVALCWHACHRPGRLYLPAGWEFDRPAALHAAPGIAFRRRLRFLRNEDRQDWYQDGRTGELLCVDQVLVTH